MPRQCYKSLATPIQPDQNIPNKLQYDSQNMTAFYEILIFLTDKFTEEPVGVLLITKHIVLLLLGLGNIWTQMLNIDIIKNLKKLMNL